MQSSDAENGDDIYTDPNEGAFNPKQIIHAIGVFLVIVSVILFVYGCYKVIDFINSQKRIRVVQKTALFESRDNMQFHRGYGPQVTNLDPRQTKPP